MSRPLWIVDAFTSSPFTGNPAGVCVLEGPAEPDWMQAVARELGLSETAFLWPEEVPPTVRDSGEDAPLTVPADDGAGGLIVHRLRWFTPVVEVELCGHATLASAHILWTEGFLALDAPAAFETLSGRLGASRDGEWIELDFPAFSTDAADAPPGLAEALGAELVSVRRCGDDYLVELADERTVRTLAPDMRLLRELPLRAVIVTAAAEAAPERPSHPADAEADFVSRFFGPGYGVDEDPVTGYAHCILGPYWGARLGRENLLGYQASRRGGHVRVGMRDGRIALGGQAVTVVRGELPA